MLSTARSHILRHGAAVLRRTGAARAARLHTGSVSLSHSILLSDNLDQVAIDMLKKRGMNVVSKPELGANPKQLIEEIPKYDGLIVRSGTQVTEDVLQAAVNLKFVGRAGTGVDNIDIDAATKKGIIVMNVPGGNTNAAAELAFGMLMAVSRNIAQGNDSLRAGRWDRKLYTGWELKGKTIGLIGTGRIGQSVAKWCQSFGMKVIGFDSLMSQSAMDAFGIEGVELEELWKRSDVLSFHTPLTDGTRGMLNDSTFAQCKDGVVVINCARGGIVDEGALLRALDSGKVRAAGLDVFTSEPPEGDALRLVDHPRVVCTPHLGASTEEAQTNVARDIAEFVADGLQGNELRGVINAPDPQHLTNPKLVPFSKLGERLGSLQASLVTGKISSVDLKVTGDKLGVAQDLLMSSVLKGLLSGKLSDGVNIVNSKLLAKDRGIRLSSTKVTSGHSRSDTMQVTIGFDTSDTVGHVSTSSGTVSPEGVPRMLKLDDYVLQLEMPFQDNVLVVKVTDKPGALAGVMSSLAENGVNVGSVSLGRTDNNPGMALLVVTVDSKVPEAVVAAVQSMDLVRFAGMSSFQPHLTNTVRDKSLPAARPMSPNFCSGPTKKRPGYVLGGLAKAPLGRSHRAAIGKAKLKQAIDDSKRVLQIPSNYLVGIVPASDTGAFEMAMWTMLGARDIDVCHWESFGKGWAGDLKHLGLTANEFTAPYGELPDLTKTNPANDILFTWNGTTSGVRVPNADWIAADREGLTFCDATSGVFAQQLDWPKLDVTTWSFQKAVGGEGGHGMIVLSPRAVERLQSFVPSGRAVPKIFRLTKEEDGEIKLIKGIFEGNVINTPSMLVIEDYLDTLNWGERVGGLPALQKRADDNLRAIEGLVSAHPGFEFLAKDPASRSNTSVCLTVDLNSAQLKKLKALLEDNNVAFDIGSYRDAPDGLRIWCGPTVDTADVQALTDWLAWAYKQAKASV